MRAYLSLLSLHKRSIFYALVSGLGLLFSLQLLKEHGRDQFFVGVVATSLVLIFDIYINWHYATRILRQIDMPTVNVYNLWGNILNHITLPLTFFYALAGFVYFNEDDLLRFVTICILVFVNIPLFINIRSYYRDEFRLEEQTQYIYDIMKLLIFFFAVNLVLHMRGLWPLEEWIYALVIAAIVLFLSMLLIYRKGTQSLAEILYIFIWAFLIASIFMILGTLEVVLLGINIVIFLCFYISLSILIHRLERTLTREVLVEYVLILVLALILFLGIS